MDGPGGPTRDFTQEELFAACATLSGGDTDRQQHNLVSMHNGYLLMPWAPEDGGGGISFYDYTDPCSPIKIGQAEHPGMRESHTLATGFAGGREYLAVDYMDPENHDMGGVGFFDITDPERPVWAGHLNLPDFSYPDAYFFVTLSTFWLGDVLYVPMGFNGVYVIDVSDPLDAQVINHIPADTLLSGSFHAIGTTAMLSNAGTTLTRFYDISDPKDPREIPGAAFDTTHPETGAILPYYFANVGGKYALFANKGNGGGPMLYDISDPSDARWVDYYHQPDAAGGYIFRHENFLFEGEGDYGGLYDMSQPDAIQEVGRFMLPGDLDTVTPIGNTALVSVDHGAKEDISTVVVPWTEGIDDSPPALELHFPVDRENFVGPNAAIGLSFNEAVNDRSVFDGSFRVSTHRGEVIAGRYYTQDTIVNFVPDEPWPDDTTIHVEIPAGGISDVSGNAISETVSFSFGTGEKVR